MRKAGIEVFDCSCSKKYHLRYIITFFKFLKCKNKCDLIFVGFLGHFIIPLVKMFTRKKVLFDAFVSVYQTMCFDRKAFDPGGFPCELARFIDRLSCRLADKVFLDTEQHIEYFVREYKLNRDKLYRLPASADDSVMFPRRETENEKFIVHFHGEFQPLHGVKYIIDAAAKLPDVKFQIIGHGRDFKPCINQVDKLGLKNVNFIPKVSYEELAEYMANASVCLGIFSDTQKASLVIPNKVYEALAMEKAVITADTPAVRELLTNEENAILCRKADSESLAESIRKLRDNPELRERIARNGRKIFREKCSPQVIGGKILDVIKAIS